MASLIDGPAEVLHRERREAAYQHVLMRLFLLLEFAEQETGDGSIPESTLRSFLDPLQSCLEREGSLVLGERDGYLFLNGIRARLDLEGFPALKYLVQALYGKGLSGILFDQGTGLGELRRFLALFRDGDSGAGEGFVATVEAAGVGSIHPIPREKSRARDLYRLDPDADFSSRKTWFRNIFVVKHLLEGRSSSCPVDPAEATTILQELAQGILGEESFLFALDDLKAWDPRLFEHSVSVALISVVLGRRMGLDHELLSELGVAALFHDLGYVGMERRVTEREGFYCSKESEGDARHESLGFRRLARHAVGSPILQRTSLIAFRHHEAGSLLPHPRPEERGRRALLRSVIEVVDLYDRLLHGDDQEGHPRLPAEALQRLHERLHGRHQDILQILGQAVGLIR